MNRHDNKDLIESLINSKIFQDYEKAFSETTGLPVSLRPVESWQLPHHGKRHENPALRHAGGKKPVLRDLPANAATALR